MEEKGVRVPGGVLWGGGVILVVSLMTTAFLAGRASVPAPVIPPPLPAATVTVAVTVTATPSPVAVVTPTPVVVPPPPAPSTHPTKAVTGDARAVADYFAAVDRLGGAGKMADDPNQAANDQIEAILAGDSSGFDKMIAQAQDSQRKLSALKPPPPCKAWHAECLAINTESVRLLTNVKKAITSQDLNTLTSIQGQANALKARAEQLQSSEQAIKHTYGI